MKAFSLFLAELNDGSTHAGYITTLTEKSGYRVLIGTP